MIVFILYSHNKQIENKAMSTTKGMKVLPNKLFVIIWSLYFKEALNKK